MKGKKHIKSVFLACIVFLPILFSACYSPPRNQFIKKEVVVNAPFVVVRDAMAQTMNEKNILIKGHETSTNATISGNLLVDVEQYADCGKYYGRKVTGYADMDVIIVVQRINMNNTGIQITSSITITDSNIMLSKERKLPCISNGRMENELLEAVMQKVR